jgi:hypothetical protein
LRLSGHSAYWMHEILGLAVMDAQCQGSDSHDKTFKISLKHISWRISAIHIRASREHSMHEEPDSNNRPPSSIEPHSDSDAHIHSSVTKTCRDTANRNISNRESRYPSVIFPLYLYRIIHRHTLTPSGDSSSKPFCGAQHFGRRLLCYWL